MIFVVDYVYDATSKIKVRTRRQLYADLYQCWGLNRFQADSFLKTMRWNKSPYMDFDTIQGYWLENYPAAKNRAWNFYIFPLGPYALYWIAKRKFKAWLHRRYREKAVAND